MAYRDLSRDEQRNVLDTMRVLRARFGNWLTVERALPISHSQRVEMTEGRTEVSTTRRRAASRSSAAASCSSARRTGWRARAQRCRAPRGTARRDRSPRPRCRWRRRGPRTMRHMPAHGFSSRCLHSARMLFACAVSSVRNQRTAADIGRTIAPAGFGMTFAGGSCATWREDMVRSEASNSALMAGGAFEAASARSQPAAAIAETAKRNASRSIRMVLGHV